MIDTAKPQATEVKTERKRRLGVKLVIAFVFAAALIAAIVSVISIGGSLSAEGVKKTWIVITGKTGDASFTFEVGFDAVFADLGSAVVAAGKSGVAVYNGEGREVARDALAVKNPAIASGAGIAIAYGVGGRGIRVADDTGIIASLTFESNIVSCSVGTSSGLVAGGTIFAVCLEGADGYKGKVSFYRLTESGPENIYNWDSGEGYVLSSEIAPGNDDFAVLTITPRGGRIVLLNRENTKPAGEYIHAGAAIIEMGYLSSGTLIARTADGLIAIDSLGNGTELYSFGGKAIAGYCDDGGNSLALYFESSADGKASGELVVIDERGNELGKISTSRTLVWLAANGDRVAVLWSDGLDIYDRSLRLAVSYPEASGMQRGYSRGASRAVVFGSREGKAFSGKAE